MNTKHYLSVFLFLSAIVLSALSVKSQISSDTITMYKKAGGYFYYVGNESLNPWLLRQLLNNNMEALKLMGKSGDLRMASNICGLIGGIGAGGSIGYVIGCKIVGRQLETKIFIPCLLAGVALIGFGIAFEISANNNAKAAIAVYNHSVKQNNTSLVLLFSPNGTLLKLNF
jgi:hypothetical protein